MYLRNDEEKDLKEMLLEKLPPVIARKNVQVLLGGVISSKTLANADSAGKGPPNIYYIGRVVFYPTKDLIDWLIKNKKIKLLKKII